MLREGSAIYRIDLTAETIHHVAGTGEQGYTGDGGPAAAATLARPEGLAFAAGRLYVADTENHVIRMLDTDTGLSSATARVATAQKTIHCAAAWRDRTVFSMGPAAGYTPATVRPTASGCWDRHEWRSVAHTGRRPYCLDGRGRQEMIRDIPKETLGAWIIHHGRKATMDADGASEFPAIDEAAKAANLLSSLGESKKTTLTAAEVTAVARACRLNPRVELRPLLNVLADRRLIERKTSSIDVIGINTRSALTHAASIFLDSQPSRQEEASIALAERTSAAPLVRETAVEYISDLHGMTTKEADDFVSRSAGIGFVDVEGQGSSRILFNGNLFRRESVVKTKNVLDSLSSEEQAKLMEFGGVLKRHGCVEKTLGEAMLGHHLLDKLIAAGVYDLNTVSNDTGDYVFVTSPNSFHKFVDPMVDDCFDMAKALASALKYGMTRRRSSEGKIRTIERLLRRLIDGHIVGPATAIGMDYRVLELNRVVQIIPDDQLFRMRLLKAEIGMLALDVLTKGDANVTAMKKLPGAPMTGYTGPEEGRMRTRRRQDGRSRRATHDILTALRGGREL